MPSLWQAVDELYEETWEVDRLLARRPSARGGFEYLTAWKDYGTEGDTWQRSCPTHLAAAEPPPRALQADARQERPAAQAHGDQPARRAQMCLRHGQAGSRGSADPLEAYGAEYLIGIVDEQVRSALPLAHPWHALD